MFFDVENFLALFQITALIDVVAKACTPFVTSAGEFSVLGDFLDIIITPALIIVSLKSKVSVI